MTLIDHAVKRNFFAIYRPQTPQHYLLTCCQNQSPPRLGDFSPELTNVTNATHASVEVKGIEPLSNKSSLISQRTLLVGEAGIEPTNNSIVWILTNQKAPPKIAVYHTLPSQTLHKGFRQY